MKKEYITPTAEKIRFNYRDQVVAASGGSQSAGGNGYSNETGCDVLNWIANEWWDGKLCFS